MGRCLPPKGRELGYGCYGAASSNNRRIQVLRWAVGQDPRCVIEIDHGGRRGVGCYTGPCSGDGSI